MRLKYFIDPKICGWAATSIHFASLTVNILTFGSQEDGIVFWKINYWKYKNYVKSHAMRMTMMLRNDSTIFLLPLDIRFLRTEKEFRQHQQMSTAIAKNWQAKDPKQIIKCHQMKLSWEPFHQREIILQGRNHTTWRFIYFCL